MPRTSFCCRNFSSYIKDDFQRDLVEYNWDSFFATVCPDEAWSILYNVILSFADVHCPFKSYSSKKSLPPWLTSEILEFLKERDQMYRLAKCSDDQGMWASLRVLRNRCTHLIARAKKDFILLKLEEHSGDAKKFWHLIDSVFTGTPGGQGIDMNLTDPDTGVPIPDNQCPDYMNAFLTSAGAKLAGQLPNIPFKNTLCDFRTSLKFRRITIEETIKEIKGINLSKSSAIENLSSRVLKDALLCLPIHLNYIFNLSIDQGLFPNAWKKANVILIPKDGPKDNPNNFRPISLLPLPGKILEKLVHQRLFSYLNENKILTDRQGGFRPDNSTTLTSSKFVMDILHAQNEGKTTAAIFVDLRKAFDTIDHRIMLKKLNTYGIRNCELKWFESYISNRQQRTMVNGVYSRYCDVTHGVPQGSVLGPVLFLLYVNDIVHAVDPSSVYLYADDTVIYDSSQKLDEAYVRLQLKLNALVEWCTMNKLTMNIKKTKSLFFFPRSNVPDVPNFVVHEQSLERVYTYKYLGYHLDSCLKFEILMTNLIKIMSYKIYLLRKLRDMLTSRAAFAVYRSKILSYFDYSAIFHFGSRLLLQKKLQVLQNLAIRIILKMPCRTNVDQKHVDLGLWHMENRRRYFLLNTMHTLIRQPDSPYVDTRSLRTRAHTGLLFKLPAKCTGIFIKSFVYQGMNTWNQLPPGIRRVGSKEEFKKQVKQMIREDEASAADGWSMVSLST